ncbi:ATP-binding protein [Streptomyces sp. NPDC059785]|uniref:ATP-binding protein n=1 Tax=Streptomyces sp. NPDC059785 TaxID=3346945 RepID=UPI003657B8FE
MDGIRRWGSRLDNEVLHTAELVISELVTNALLHTGAKQISLRVRLTASVVRIEVHDSSPLLPQRSAAASAYKDSESGRGLLLVAALADRHGVEPMNIGKRCWAELATASALSTGDSTAAHTEEADSQRSTLTPTPDTTSRRSTSVADRYCSRSERNART